MIPTALYIENFRSFEGVHEFKFPTEPGLYFLQGINEAEPRLGSNGAGKSTIWDALLWCIFGKTARGLKARDVCNWHVGKKTVVSFCYEFGGEQYAMTRGWSPNFWTLKSEQGDEWDLAKTSKGNSLNIPGWNDVSFTAFCNSVITSQRQTMFLDQSPESKAQLFTQIMELDKWDRASENARASANAHDKRYHSVQTELARLTGQLQGLDIEDAKDRHAEWKADRDKRLDELENKFAKLLKEEAAKNKLLGQRTEELETLIQELETASAEYNRSKARLDKLTHAIDVHITYTNRLYDDLERQKGGVCPTCGQRIQDHSTARRLEREIKEANDKANVQLDEEAELKKTYEKDRAYYEAMAQKLKDFEGPARQEAQDLKWLRELLDRVEDDVKRITEEVSPYADQIKEGTSKRRKLEQEIGKLDFVLEDIAFQRSVAEYWIKGFKELRLQLISETLTELEIEVNNSMEALGLLDWEIGFAVDRETKAKTIQRGFHVTVKSPTTADSVAWEAWSGGETQRLMLGATMGLADLTRAKTGLVFPMEVWDEPTRGLSQQGMLDLMRALEARAISKGWCIWLVDHTAHAYGGLKGGATVVKTKQGSHVKTLYTE